MGKTCISISGKQFLINGQPVYADIPGSNPQVHGLLFNQRMIQGIYDDQGNREMYAHLAQRDLKELDPEKNSDALIAALPEWYRYGLRAITVGLQGGWPVGMGNVEAINHNPFGPEGDEMDPAFFGRMQRIIEAADEIGMIIIVNIFYWAQAQRMSGAHAILKVLRNTCHWIKDHGWTNVMIDVANEFDIPMNKNHPILQTDEGIATLIEIAKVESGVPVGSSGCGGTVEKQAARASDFVIVHGNQLSRGELYDLFRHQREIALDKPILCNEDSPCFTRVDVSVEAGCSWGYYNNYTKQIPPCFWGVTRGEDLFFARRMARAIGIPVEPLPREDQFVLMGLNPEEAFTGLHTMRVACEFPEEVNKVTFYKNGEKIYTSYDEAFFCYTENTWLGTPFKVEKGDVYRADILLVDGTIITREQSI